MVAAGATWWRVSCSLGSLPFLVNRHMLLFAEDFARHAFISYAREDRAEVDLLERTLAEAGIPVWRDTAAVWPGEDWRTRDPRGDHERLAGIYRLFLQPQHCP